MVSSKVFILEEAEAMGGVVVVVFALEVIGDMRVKVSNGGGLKINGNTCPMVVVPVEGEDQLPI